MKLAAVTVVLVSVLALAGEVRAAQARPQAKSCATRPLAVALRAVAGPAVRCPQLADAAEAPAAARRLPRLPRRQGRRPDEAARPPDPRGVHARPAGHLRGPGGAAERCRPRLHRPAAHADPVAAAGGAGRPRRPPARRRRHAALAAVTSRGRDDQRLPHLPERQGVPPGTGHEHDGARAAPSPGGLCGRRRRHARPCLDALEHRHDQRRSRTARPSGRAPRADRVGLRGGPELVSEHRVRRRAGRLPRRP